MIHRSVFFASGAVALAVFTGGCHGTGATTSPLSVQANTSNCPVVFDAKSIESYPAADVVVVPRGAALQCQVTNAKTGAVQTLSGYTAVTVVPRIVVNGDPSVSSGSNGTSELVIPVALPTLTDPVLQKLAAQIARDGQDIVAALKAIQVSPPHIDLALIQDLPKFEAELKDVISNGKQETAIVIQFAQTYSAEINQFIAGFKQGQIPINLIQIPRSIDDVAQLLGLTNFDQFHAELGKIEKLVATDALKDLWNRVKDLTAADFEKDKTAVMALALDWLDRFKIPAQDALTSLQEMVDYAKANWSPQPAAITATNVLDLLTQLKLLQRLAPTDRINQILAWIEKLQPILGEKPATQLQDAIQMVNNALFTPEQQAFALQAAQKLIADLGLSGEQAWTEAVLIAGKFGVSPGKLEAYISAVKWLTSLGGVHLSLDQAILQAKTLLIDLGMSPQQFQRLQDEYAKVASQLSGLAGLSKAILAVFQVQI